MSRFPRNAPRLLLAFVVALAFAMSACAPRDEQSPEALAGHWEGSIAYRDETLPVDLDVEVIGGELVTRLTAPDLLMRDVEVKRFHYRSPKVLFRIPVGDDAWLFNGWFRRNVISGSLSGGSLPRSFRPSDRPQMGLRRVERRPDPFVTDTVRFAGGAASLAGTVLADTAGRGPRPAVVLIAPGARDTRATCRELADRFARAGFVTLAFDSRGCGASGGAPAASYSDLELDAAEAAEYLRSRPDVDPARVGLVGSGECARLVPRVALRVHTAFAAAISPPAEPDGRGPGVPEWARSEAQADPAAPWGAITAPALVLVGERDPRQKSAARLRESFASGGHRNARVEVVPRAGAALLLETRFGERWDFPRTAPGGLDTLLAWSRREAGLPPARAPLVPQAR